MMSLRGICIHLLVLHVVLFVTDMVEGNSNNNYGGRKLVQMTATYEYQIEFNTTTYPDEESARQKFDQESLQELNDELGDDVDEFSIDSMSVQACQQAETTSERCFEAESTVTITINEDDGQEDTIVEKATIERVQSFLDAFNAENADIYVSFIGPFYISSELNIDIAPVNGYMDDTAKGVFEDVLVIHLERYFANQEGDNDVSNIEATVLFQVLTAIQRRLQRRLEQQSNRVTSFVSGECNRCAGKNDMFQDAANSFDMDQFQEDLKIKGEEAGTDYFDNVDDVSYSENLIDGLQEPVVPPLGNEPDDKKQPFWVWVALGVATAIFAGVFILLFTKKKIENAPKGQGDFASAVAHTNRENEEGLEVARESSSSEQPGMELVESRSSSIANRSDDVGISSEQPGMEPVESRTSSVANGSGDFGSNSHASRPGKYGEQD